MGIDLQKLCRRLGFDSLVIIIIMIIIIIAFQIDSNIN